MTEKSGDPEINQHKKIRFLNVANEGNRWFSFVVCPTKSTDVIIYAWLNNLVGTTHTSIFELAVDDYGFNEKHEPIGGGVIDSKTCSLQDSIHYGRVDDPAIEMAVRHKAHCESDYLVK